MSPDVITGRVLSERHFDFSSRKPRGVSKYQENFVEVQKLDIRTILS